MDSNERNVDVPELCNYCNSILEKHRVLEQQAINVDIEDE